MERPWPGSLADLARNDPQPEPEVLQPSPRMMCPNCFSEVGQGKKHLCTKGTLLKNVAEKMTPRTKEKHVASVVKEKVKETGMNKVRYTHRS